MFAALFNFSADADIFSASKQIGIGQRTEVEVAQVSDEEPATAAGETLSISLNQFHLKRWWPDPAVRLSPRLLFLVCETISTKNFCAAQSIAGHGHSTGLNTK